MSHVALQRVVVRMLFDPPFAELVYRDPDRALAWLDLTGAEREWLRRPDARAYRTDPMRRARTLTGLLEEYPASAALAGDARALDAFFSTTTFHRCIQDGGSLADAFGIWLRGAATPDRSPWMSPVLRLEWSIAALRRRRPARLDAGPRLVLDPRVDLLELPAGTLECYGSMLGALGAKPVEALLTGNIPAAPATPPGSAPETALVRVDARDSASAEVLPEALFALLAFARTPRTRPDLLDEARRLGAEADDAAEIVDGLVNEGILVAAG